MNKLTKLSNAIIATGLFCAPMIAMATVTVSTDTTWSSGTYSEDVVIAGGAKLTVNGNVTTSDAINVGDSSGGSVLEVSNGTIHAAKRIRFNPEVLSALPANVASEDYVSEVIVKTDAIASSSMGLNLNCQFPSAVRFQGGQLRFNGYGGNYPLFVCGNNGAIHLCGEDGNDIKFDFNNNNSSQKRYFLQNFSSTGTSLVFEGNCDVTMSGNATTPLDMRVYGSGSSNNYSDKLVTGYGSVSWNQTGDLVLKNNIQMTLGGDMMLPFGAQTGGVKLDAATARLDFNGRRAAVNAITVTQGLVTNSSATAATLVLGLDNADANLSDIVKGDLKGVFNYEKAGSGTLTIDKGAYGTLTVAEGAVAFAAAPGTSIAVDSLVVDSATMKTLVVDGVALTVGTAGGTALGGVAVVTRNGGTFTCGSWDASDNATLREPDLAATDALVKPGAGILTIVSTNSLPAKLDVRSGTIRFRTPYLTGGAKMLLKYVFKQTYGTNQKLCLEEIRGSGFNELGAASDNIFQAHASNFTTYYPIQSSLADVFNQGGIWVDGKYAEYSTGSNVPLPYPPYYLFDRNNSTPRVYSPTNTVPVLSNPASWQTVAFKIHWWNADKKLMGYNFTKGLFQKNNGSPISWTLSASTNGTDWVTIDERIGVAVPEEDQWHGLKWYNGGTDFPVIGLGPERGIGASAAVRVDNGATLDVEGLADSERTISALEIDMAVGGGHITTFAPAANGVLDIVNFSGTLGENTDLGLTFDAIVNAANLNTWTVRVNGIAKPKRVAARNGKLVVLADATVIMMR